MQSSGPKMLPSADITSANLIAPAPLAIQIFRRRHRSSHGISYQTNHLINVTNSFSLYYQNCRGLNTKIPEFYNKSCALNINVICLTETWMTPLVDSYELMPSEYKVYRKDRVGRRGGGVLLAVNNALISKNMNLVCKIPAIYLTGVSVKLNNKCIIVLCMYVPPGLSSRQYTELFDYLDSAVDKSESILIIGDFNIPNYAILLKMVIWTSSQHPW